MKRTSRPDVRTEAGPTLNTLGYVRSTEKNRLWSPDQRRTGLRKPACSQGIEYPFTVGAALLAGFCTTCRGRHRHL